MKTLIYSFLLLSCMSYSQETYTFKSGGRVFENGERIKGFHNTFKRMEKAGELIERHSGFYQHFHNYLFKSVIYEKMDDIITAEELEEIKKEIEKNIEVIEDNPPF